MARRPRPAAPGGPALAVRRPAARFFIAKENAADLAALRELIEAGRVTPAVDRAYPLAEVPAAIRRLQDGRVVGKVAITIE